MLPWVAQAVLVRTQADRKIGFCTLRLRGLHPDRDELLGSHVDVELQLVIELILP
jgi:hypothetical protein